MAGMRISTAAFQRNALNGFTDLQKALNERQVQLSTGKKITKVSDNPLASAQIQRIQEQLSVIDSNNSSADAAERHLNFEESVFKTYTNVLIRFKELLVQSGNVETLSATDRAAIGREMQERLNELQGIANTQDAQGEYIFSGYQALTKPFTQDASGRYSYNGDQGQRFIQVGSDTQVAVSDPGKNIFIDIPAQAGTFATAATSSNTGTGLISPGTVINATTWQASVATNESYTLTFNPIGNTFDVAADSAPGVPLAGLDDVPYTAGMSVTVAGVSFTLSGNPLPGDSFTLQPVNNQDVFTTLDRVSDTLLNSNNTTNIHFDVDLALANVNNAIDVANEARTKIGGRLNTIESERLLNSDLKIAGQTTLSKLQEVDYPEVISEISQLTFALESSQRSFIRIQELNLFSFL